MGNTSKICPAVFNFHELFVFQQSSSYPDLNAQWYKPPTYIGSTVSGGKIDQSKERYLEVYQKKETLRKIRKKNF